MIRALIVAELANTPQERTSKTGNPSPSPACRSPKARTGGFSAL